MWCAVALRYVRLHGESLECRLLCIIISVGHRVLVYIFFFIIIIITIIISKPPAYISRQLHASQLIMANITGSIETRIQTIIYVSFSSLNLPQIHIVIEVLNFHNPISIDAVILTLKSKRLSCVCECVYRCHGCNK